jgi:glucose-1-phosphate cytidylyltransferase
MSRAETAVADLPVVILCGGQGTRIREAAEQIPKPLVDIGGRPILWHIMKIYSRFGCQRFILCLGYKSNLIKEYFLSYRAQLADFTIRMSNGHDIDYHNQLGDEAWEVTCAETGLFTGTGGRLLRVKDYLDTDTFLFTYGDGVADVDIAGLVDFHHNQGRIGTVTGVRPASRYGELQTDGSAVKEFAEKPGVEKGMISGGFFVFNRGIFDYLSAEPELMLEQDPLRKLAGDGELSVFPHEGYWIGMDTYRDYMELNRLWRTGAVPWNPDLRFIP